MKITRKISVNCKVIFYIKVPKYVLTLIFHIFVNATWLLASYLLEVLPLYDWSLCLFRYCLNLSVFFIIIFCVKTYYTTSYPAADLKSICSEIFPLNGVKSWGDTLENITYPVIHFFPFLLYHTYWRPQMWLHASSGT